MPGTQRMFGSVVILAFLALGTALALGRDWQQKHPGDSIAIDRCFAVFTLATVPTADRPLVEFLLLLPPMTLFVCVVRNVIGLQTFGTFAPALLGIAFRDSPTWLGIGLPLVIVFVGWFLRSWVHRLRLLQVPRSAFMLSCIVCGILGVVMLAQRFGYSLAGAMPLLPLVILTGMIERFWSMDEEEGTGSSLRTLSVTLSVSLLITLLCRWKWLTGLFWHSPELLAFIMAGQIAIGRYTGYRLIELYRFRQFIYHSSKEIER